MCNHVVELFGLCRVRLFLCVSSNDPTTEMDRYETIKSAKKQNRSRSTAYKMHMIRLAHFLFAISANEFDFVSSGNFFSPSFLILRNRES